MSNLRFFIKSSLASLVLAGISPGLSALTPADQHALPATANTKLARLLLIKNLRLDIVQNLDCKKDSNTKLKPIEIIIFKVKLMLIFSISKDLQTQGD